MPSSTYSALDIRLFGIVQGVGMRPTIWRIAHAHQIGGWVQNGVGGVLIHAVGTPDQLEDFLDALLPGMPVRAQIDRIEHRPAHVDASDLTADGSLAPFFITASNTDASSATLVSFDIATCDTCLAELFDPSDRRYHYPFINCTDCGPRFTIIKDLPYDRCTTSMGAFEMCDACSEEYHNPQTRRFDAQPDACFLCGPQLEYLDASGKSFTVTGTTVPARRRSSDAIIEHCVQRLKSGAIVAIKGLGGFHLVVDAQNEAAVLRLRHRKRRSRKALAIMVPSLTWAHRLAQINEAQAAELTSCRRPIVLLPQKVNDDTGIGTQSAPEGPPRSQPHLAPSVTNGLPEVGIMLPYTPLHHLLLAAFEGPLVMTSGNISSEPICATNEEALTQLAAIADDFLLHNREIVTRFDDSVVRVINTTPQIIRRARGYAPLPLPLEPSLHDTICIGATGAEQKDTCALASIDCVYLSQHLGDLEHLGIMNLFEQVTADQARLFRLHPLIWAHDAHPEYLSTKWAISRAATDAVPRCIVQHHHAHIASVLGEHQTTAPVIGLALDGTGYAQTPAVTIEMPNDNRISSHKANTDQLTDDPHGHLVRAMRRAHEAHHQLNLHLNAQAPQTCNYPPTRQSIMTNTERTQLWGGELFITTPEASIRVGTLQSLALVGGVRAIQEPWRIAYAWLKQAELTAHPGAHTFLQWLEDTHPQERALVDTMMVRELNTIYSSSAGRLFDAISALLGICPSATYEGEPAIMLEAALTAWPNHHIGCDTAAQLQRNTCFDQRYFLTPTTYVAHADEQDANAHTQELPLTILEHTRLLQAILDDLAAEVTPAQIAARFHEAFAQSLIREVKRLSGVYSIDTCAYAGGVCMNKTIASRIHDLLVDAQIKPITNRDLPVNDGSIAFGQCVAARALLARTTEVEGDICA